MHEKTRTFLRGYLEYQVGAMRANLAENKKRLEDQERYVKELRQKQEMMVADLRAYEEDLEKL